jgi:aminoglycoside phosphotransferase (APT) family kinase protein
VLPQEDPDKRNAVLGEIGLSGRIRSVEFIDAGYSTDRKYLVTLNDGARRVLRLSGIEDEAARQFEFQTIGRLHELGILCAETFAFGTFADVCYGLYGYFDGECASDALPKLTVVRQFEIGLHAGEQLRAIQFWSEPPGKVDEFEVRGGKYARHVAQLAELGITFSGQEIAHQYASGNMHLLHGRPTTFRHGDFHPSNLIIRDGSLVGVIDFNRCDWGDPYDDFYKTAFFGAPASENFATGLVTGYFRGEPPAEFWPLYNLFVAATLPADLIWSRLLFPKQFADSVIRVERITRTHDFVSGGPPEWFVIQNDPR